MTTLQESHESQDLMRARADCPPEAMREIRRIYPYTCGLRSVHLSIEDGKFVMRGVLPAFYLGQKLLSIAQRAAGRTSVRDEIRVVVDSTST
jgi:hypothetical protein